MKNKAHHLWDPISGEGAMTFVVLDPARVEVAWTPHPDIPYEVEVLPIEKARESYLAAIKAGWLPVE